jgi:hypothetical protein
VANDAKGTLIEPPDQLTMNALAGRQKRVLPHDRKTGGWGEAVVAAEGMIQTSNSVQN